MGELDTEGITYIKGHISDVTGQKFFWNQKFLDKKFAGPKNLFEQNVFDSNFFLDQNAFESNIYWTNIFLTQFFLHWKFFQPNFFWLISFWLNILLDQHFLNQKYVFDQILFWTKNILDKIFFLNQNCFWIKNFFRAKKYIWPKKIEKKLSLQRYLQNNTGICLILNFQYILHIIKILASKYLKDLHFFQILVMFS